MQQQVKVQLTAPRLDRARRHTQSSLDNLLALGEIVATELGAEVRADEIREIRFRIGSAKLIFLDANGDCSYVYEDPPGVCRGCSGGEISD
jgi:hypothetical protein